MKDEDLKKKDINSSSLQSACSSVHLVCTVDGVLAGLGLGCGDLLDGEPPAHDLLGDIDHLLLPDLDVQKHPLLAELAVTALRIVFAEQEYDWTANMQRARVFLQEEYI